MEYIKKDEAVEDFVRWTLEQLKTRFPAMTSKEGEVRVGVKAPEFLIETPDGRFPLHQLAARHQKLVLTTQDSYRYHPN